MNEYIRYSVFGQIHYSVQLWNLQQILQLNLNLDLHQNQNLYLHLNLVI